MDPVRNAKQLIADALRVIATGGLSIEAILTHATTSPDFRRWLAKQTERGHEPRRLQLTRAAPVDPAVIAKALQTANKRFRSRGVLAAAWGTAVRSGVNTGTACIVLSVRDKVRLDRLPRPLRLPKTLTIRHRGRSVALPVDVQRVPLGRKEAAQVHPGDLAMAIVGAKKGTIGAIAKRAAGTSAIISGHLAILGAAVTGRLGSGDEVRLGTVERVRNDDRIDGARVDGVDPADVPFLSDSARPIRDLTDGDLNIQLTVHRAQGDGDSHAFIDGLDMLAEFGNDDGTTSPMYGLIKLSKKVSRSGDSGAPVIDSASRLVGFVIGSADGHTYVIPARKVLDAML